MRLSDLLPELDVVEIRGESRSELRRVTRDSRQVGADAVFVAIEGGRIDGHDLVAGLHNVGAVVIARQVEAPKGVPVVRVHDTRLALAQLAAALEGHPSRAVPVVGVTGTNGKTTVTTLIAQVAARLERPAGRIGTTGVTVAGRELPSQLTTPEAPVLQSWFARMRREGCEVIAMEVSSIGLVQRRVDGTRFHTTVFTNLGHNHPEFHGTLEAYRQAKARLFGELLRPPGGPPRALLFGDDPSWRQMGAPEDHWTYGFGEHDLAIRDWSSSTAGTRLTLLTPAGEIGLESPLVGRFNAENLAATVGVGLTLGWPLEDLADALRHVSGAPGRMQRVDNPHGLLVLVDYAHTPAALKLAIDAVRPVTSGKIWVVFGCGGDRDRTKRPKMGRAALSADMVVVTSDNPRSEDPLAIIHDITAAIAAEAHVEPDRGLAIRFAVAEAQPGDTILIAGKGHESTQTVGDEARPFDDVAVAAAALEAR